MPIYPQQNNFQPKNPAPLDYDLQSEKQRIAEATEEIKKELLEKWQRRYAGTQILPDKISGLNPELVNFLLSFRHTLFYNSLAKKFNLDQKQRDALPHIVWNVCLVKNWEDLPGIIQEKIGLNGTSAAAITSEINQNILSKAKSFPAGNFTEKKPFTEKSIQTKLETLTVADALKKYPEIGEQIVSDERIESKTRHGLVRPAIGNWIADYRYVMGFGHHDAIGRANYLFQSINGRKLSSSERQRLAYLLKAFDENQAVAVNKDLKQIVFPEFSANRIAPSAEKEAFRQKPSIRPVTAPSSPSAPKLPTASLDKLKAFFRDAPPVTPRPAQISASQSPTQPSARQPDNQKTGQPDNQIRFSSPQKLPYEKEKEAAQKDVPAPHPEKRHTQTFRRNPVSGIIYDKNNGQ